MHVPLTLPTFVIRYCGRPWLVFLDNGYYFKESLCLVPSLFVSVSVPLSLSRSLFPLSLSISVSVAGFHHDLQT